MIACDDMDEKRADKEMYAPRSAMCMSWQICSVYRICLSKR